MILYLMMGQISLPYGERDRVRGRIKRFNVGVEFIRPELVAEGFSPPQRWKPMSFVVATTCPAKAGFLGRIVDLFGVHRP